MQRTKSFDAVEMKHRIQEQVRESQVGLSKEELAKRTQEWLMTGDDPVASLWRRAELGPLGHS
jgi:hypothetical protein